MAARKWSIANYNAFIKEAKRSQGVSHGAAQKMYRAMRDRAGRPQRAADIKAHPRAAKNAATKASRAEGRERAARKRAGKLAEGPAKIARAEWQRGADACRTVAEYEAYLKRFAPDQLRMVDVESSEEPIITGRS